MRKGSGAGCNGGAMGSGHGMRSKKDWDNEKLIMDALFIVLILLILTLIILRVGLAISGEEQPPTNCVWSRFGPMCF